jgi:signal transduction histidine kinase
MRHRDGSWRTVELIANNQLDNPAVHGIVVTSRDVTERQRALDEKQQLEAQLWQAQKLEALGVLAGGIAHDFNNLLTSVVGFTTLAAEDLQDGNGAKAHLDEAISACDRARELVQQMLTFGRRHAHRTQAVDIAARIAETLRLLRATIPKSIEIRESIDPGCGDIMADPVQLQQVLMNLSTNAYQAMASGSGMLQVELEAVEMGAADAAAVPGLHVGRFVRLAVRDNGPGIDPAIQDRIFEPFFTTKEVGEGSGLGLSVVHGIVASHGGALKVESVLGRGSCFSVYFPQLSEVAPASSPRLDEENPASEHVLFVDDEESVVRLARQILDRLGYRVTALKHGAKCLDIFRSQRQASTSSSPTSACRR